LSKLTTTKNSDFGKGLPGCRETKNMRSEKMEKKNDPFKSMEGHILIWEDPKKTKSACSIQAVKFTKRT